MGKHIQDGDDHDEGLGIGFWFAVVAFNWIIIFSLISWWVL